MKLTAKEAAAVYAARTHKGDVMERRNWNVGSRSSRDATIYEDRSQWVGQVSIDYADQIVNDHNQHAQLVEQRDCCLEALKGVAIMLNTELEGYEQEPWAQRVRAALAHEPQAKGGSND